MLILWKFFRFLNSYQANKYRIKPNKYASYFAGITLYKKINQIFSGLYAGNLSSV